MSKLSVTVLCPGGRRVNVKVTPTTSILQIINEACKKQQLDPDQYNLKHLRHTLDSSSNIRFSNIPNNAQLELIKCIVPRDSGVVTVNLATNEGGRMMFDFSCKTSIWDILQHFEASGDGRVSIPSPDDECEPIVIYTMQRISGNLLRETTLQSLGLYNGKCMLRYDIQKKAIGGPEQANVSGPLKRPKPASPPNLDLLQSSTRSNNSQNDKFLRRNSEVSNSYPNVSNASALIARNSDHMDVDPVLAAEIPQQNECLPAVNRRIPAEPDVVESSHLNQVPDVIADQAIVSAPDVLAVSEVGCPIDLLTSSNMETVRSPDFVPESESVSMDIGRSPDFIPQAAAANADHSQDVIPEAVDMDTGKPPDFVPQAFSVGAQAEKCPDFVPEVISLGTHSSFIFSQDEAHSVEFEEESNDFFELSRDDVLKLHKERRHELQSLEERPLLTKEMRTAQQSSQLLWTLRHHPVTQIRIVFADRLIIQATFKPTDTVESVEDFIRPMLRIHNMEFTLCTHFPKLVLKPSMTLFEANCIPRALLYFTTDQICEEGQSWLNSDTKEKKSSFNAAANAVVKTRSSANTSCNMESPCPGPSMQKAPTSVNVEVTEHTSNPQNKPNVSSKKPKWFKL